MSGGEIATATANLAARALEAGVPKHLINGLVRYAVDGLRPGGFLVACLANDLLNAARRADPESLAGLGAVARFIVEHVPGRAVLSYENVDRFIRDRAAERAIRGDDEDLDPADLDPATPSTPDTSYLEVRHPNGAHR